MFVVPSLSLYVYTTLPCHILQKIAYYFNQFIAFYHLSSLFDSPDPLHLRGVAVFISKQKCIHDTCLSMVAASILACKVYIVPRHLHVGMTEHSLNGKGVSTSPEQQ